MINQKEIKSEFFNTTIFVVLFFLFICAFTNKPEPSIRRVIQYELSTNFHTDLAEVNNAQQINCENGLIPLVDKLNRIFSNNTYKVANDNKLINHKFLSLHKSEKQILPLIHLICLIQHQHFDAEELPILS